LPSASWKIKRIDPDVRLTDGVRDEAIENGEKPGKDAPALSPAPSAEGKNCERCLKKGTMWKEKKELIATLAHGKFMWGEIRAKRHGNIM